MFTCVIFVMAILAFVGAMALIAFSGTFSMIFLGLPRTETSQKVVDDVLFSMRLPMIVLAVYCLVIGLLPQGFVKIVSTPVSGFTFLVMPENLLNIISIVNIALLSLIGVILLLRNAVLQNKQVEYKKRGDAVISIRQQECNTLQIHLPDRS